MHVWTLHGVAIPPPLCLITCGLCHMIFALWLLGIDKTQRALPQEWEQSRSITHYRERSILLFQGILLREFIALARKWGYMLTPACSPDSPSVMWHAGKPHDLLWRLALFDSAYKGKPEPNPSFSCVCNGDITLIPLSFLITSVLLSLISCKLGPHTRKCDDGWLGSRTQLDSSQSE